MYEFYENALIVVLIFGITWIMFLYWNKSQEGFTKKSNRAIRKWTNTNLRNGVLKAVGTIKAVGRISGDYISKNCMNTKDVAKNYISKTIVQREYLPYTKVNSLYTLTDLVNKNYTSNTLIPQKYVDKKTYNAVNGPIIKKQSRINDISNNVLFFLNEKPVKVYIADKENVKDLNNNSTLTNAKVWYNKTLIIYFKDVPNCLQLKKYNIKLIQGNNNTTYSLADFSNPVCGLNFNKGPYKLKII